MLFNHINHLQVQHNNLNSTSTIPATKSSQHLCSSSLSAPPSNPPLIPENDEPVEHRKRPTLRRKRVNEGSNKEALLAANRRSGKKCRYRKMIILEELQGSVSKLSKQQSELIQQNAILKKERDMLRQVEKEEELELQFFPPVQFPIHPVAVSSLPEVEEPQPSYNENLQQIHNFIKQIQNQQTTSILPVFPPLHILNTQAPSSLAMNLSRGTIGFC